MQKPYILLSLLILISVTATDAQTRVYKNYNVKDGLASSTVYFVLKDAKGFMWFGTSQGLSRFDGTNFKTYTTRDGLPDNEVFRMVEDSTGRLWMIGYSSRPSYMYHGQIHNAENDSLLKQIEPQKKLFKDICADRKGRTWILGDKIYLIEQNKLHKYNNPGGKGCTGVGYIDNQLSLVTTDGVYEVKESADSLHFRRVMKMEDTENNHPVFHDNNYFIIQVTNRDINTIMRVRNDSMITKDLLQFGIHEVIWGYNVYNTPDSMLLISAVNQGLKAFDNDLNPLPDPYPFLPTNTIYTYTAFDQEGNTWISSTENGVFFIPHTRIYQYKLDSDQNITNSTSVLSTKHGRIIAGFDQSHYGVLDHDTLTPFFIKNSSFTRKRIVRIASLNKQTVAIGADYGFYLIDKNGPMLKAFPRFESVKTIVYEGPDSILVGTISYAYRITKSISGYKFDTLSDRRTTAICRDHTGKIWLGGIDGLLTYEKGKVIRFAQNDAITKSRITDLLCDDRGTIWVATNQRGAFAITPDSIYAINGSNGLPSDMCTRLISEGNGIIWIGTNRNVSQVTLTDPENFSFNISTLSNLFNSDRLSINDMATDSTFLWIATNEGLYKLQKKDLKASISLPVYITSFHASNPDSLYSSTNPIRLKYFQNNVQVEYIGISYAGGKVLYRYLMNQNSGDTLYTTTSTLNFSSLAPGKYSLQIWAKTVIGEWSREPASIDFEILPPFWWTWWFISIALLLLTLILTTGLRTRIAYIRNRELEKTAVNKKISEIELQALRAQMNEHFIFNSLNSIQNFINQNNTEAANFYLASFGKLIRRTMDISSESSISLQDEINYLDNYLTLEKMRFGDKFDYLLTNEITTVSTEIIIFPSMILQPHVENAIRHGLRYKTDGKGKLSISFALHQEWIICRIEDNGIGRGRSKELKSTLHIEYQSKGTKLSEDKIYLYNKVHNDRVRIEVEDNKNGDGDTTGTVVNVFVPFKTNL